MELADARDSKSRDGNIVWVRPPPSAPYRKSTVISRCFFGIIKQIGGRTGGDSDNPVNCRPPRRDSRRLVGGAIHIVLRSPNLFWTAERPPPSAPYRKSTVISRCFFGIIKQIGGRTGGNSDNPVNCRPPRRAPTKNNTNFGLTI